MNLSLFQSDAYESNKIVCSDNFTFVSSEQFTAMSDELERRREECLQLRAMLAEKSITTHAIAKESYGGMDDIVNEDNELALAYRTQKELNR